MAVRKYGALYSCALRHQLRYMRSFLARNVFFVVILFIFYSLWRVIFAGNPAVAGFSIAQTLWYMTFTETVELCKTRVHGEIQAEVRDGSIAYALLRPYSYVLATVARAMGQATARVAPIMAVGFVVALAFAGPLPGYLSALPFGLLLIAGGLLLGTLWMLLFGLLAFWVEEVGPFVWIFQKLTLIIGGVFLPIDFFPVWMQGIARALPFAFTAYWPALTMVKWSWGTFLHALAGQLGYIAVLGLVAAAIFRVAERKVQSHGG
jgi:ABC-2 type transport system permease protein